MDIQITVRHERKVSDEMKDFIEAGVEDLVKFHDKITSAHIILDREDHKEGEEDIVELILNIQGGQVSAKAVDENLGKAYDAVIDKMTVQLKKRNDKVKSHK